MLDPLSDQLVPPAIMPSAPGEAHDLRALPANQRTNLMAGDLVAVNCPSVNGRAWMSRIAPVRRSLKRGTRAELLSDPTRSEGAIWVKLRVVDDASDHYYFVAARYLDLVEARADVPLSIELPAEEHDETGHVSLPNDLVYTAVTVNLRIAPGMDSEILRELTPGTVATVLSAPGDPGSEGWMQLQLPDRTGWAANSHLRHFARAQKWIEVDLASQTLVAWNGSSVDRRLTISSGKPGFRTPSGIFSITTKLPSRRAIGRVNGEHWDIPGVPWVMVFRSGGFYFHGAYWHEAFGSPASHGCVTLSVPDAEWIYDWTPANAPVWIHP